MSARLPVYNILDAVAVEAERISANMRLLADLEFERDPPLTEQERWHEKLGRISPKRKQVCSFAGALGLSGTKLMRSRR